MSDDWPTLGQELSRKALGALEDAVFKFEHGEMSGPVLYAVVNALTDTVSGLVTPDVTDMIYRVRKELNLGPE